MSFEVAAMNAGLEPQVGKQAVESKYRSLIDIKKGLSFTHSVDLDTHFRATEPQENRWDYGIGVVKQGVHYAIWIEPHGATSGREVDKVLAKLRWLKNKLSLQDWTELDELTNRTSDSFRCFIWLVPGTVSFRRGSPEDKKLAQNGMKMPTKRVIIDSI